MFIIIINNFLSNNQLLKIKTLVTSLLNIDGGLSEIVTFSLMQLRHIYIFLLPN